MRIIGGTFRGRRLRYHGDPVVRPMKHRTRESIFNLVSTECAGRHAIDLFAGTGALGLEALSRGAASATFIEKHVPSARIVEENIRTLGVEDRATCLSPARFYGASAICTADRTKLPAATPVARLLQPAVCVLSRTAGRNARTRSAHSRNARRPAAFSSSKPKSHSISGTSAMRITCEWQHWDVRFTHPPSSACGETARKRRSARLRDQNSSTVTSQTATQRSLNDAAPACSTCSILHCRGALSGRQRTSRVPWRKRPPVK